ncbi:nucleotide exchange factor GrpE [Agathobaculum sp.]|uniref:nucleotide exchange factor GrpE n=1 Tax=Agathobaculum sp. TaxID=2048138 RepID=UPI002A7F5C2D|nr:nucleotide exchange factor GrpE [Agathobaculum sp.]MDY3617495.1 nucleotide exchange factor GrpE [Agathobaculum sp.]
MSKKKQPEAAESIKEAAKQTAEPAEETAAAQAEPSETPAEDWEAKFTELNDRYLRMAAEYDNFRKRSQREREQAHADAVSHAVKALLPTYDNLERALKAETADAEYKKGVELTMTQLVDSLKSLNVTIIPADAGTLFDPNLMNAVMHVEDDSLGENVVAEVFQQGFMTGDKVIRHAMVKVAN